MIPLVWALGLVVWLVGAASAATLTHGPMLGDVTTTSAVVWVRTSAAATVLVESSLLGDFTDAVASVAIITDEAADWTAQLRMVDLPVRTLITYRVRLDGAIAAPSKTFLTALPVDTAEETIRIPVFSDWARADSFPGLAAAFARDPAFVVFLGDFDHANNTTGLTGMRAMHRRLRDSTTILGQDVKAGLVTPEHQLPLYHMNDDHDGVGDDGNGTSPRVPSVRQAMREYFVLPGDTGPGTSLWQAWSYGFVDLAMPDLRTERSPKQDADTAAKTMLGSQLPRLKAWLLASTAPWKLILSTVPWNPTSKDSDSWKGYQTEANDLLAFIAANGITGVLIASGDMHTGGGLDDGTFARLPEMNVPRANHCGNQTGKLGLWSHGIDTSAVGPGFGEFVLTRTSATLTILSEAGLIRRSMTLSLP